MPRHEIEVGLPAHQVLNTDLVVVVKTDGKRLGELTLSRGTVDWRPAKHQYRVSMRWETFNTLMERYHHGELS
jgi:hypothetical protein